MRCSVVVSEGGVFVAVMQNVVVNIYWFEA